MDDIAEREINGIRGLWLSLYMYYQILLFEAESRIYAQ